MAYVETTPAELLSGGWTAPQLNDGAWHVRWDAAGADPSAAVRQHVPAAVDFHTSGSTGPGRCWRRSREALWQEAGMLAELVRPERPEAVVAFAPPAHLYGALASVLMPASLAVPVWYRSAFVGALPDVTVRRIAVVATPWIFTLLLHHLSWVRRFDHVTVLHSSAMLPATAGDLLDAVGHDRALVVEVLGSTETGGIATRRWRAGAPPPWTLLPDVSFAGPVPVGTEMPLVVRTPRLAFRPGEPAPATWRTDDHVRAVDSRSFTFAGRRNRLVKVNGRRLDLDEAEEALRGVLECADLALVPVTDPMIGEHLDLVLVLRPGTALADAGLSAVASRIGVRPRKVHVLPRIDRSPTGKVRRDQPFLTIDTEVAR